MSARLRPLLAVLPVVLVGSVALGVPAVAQDGDQGELEFLEEFEQAPPLLRGELSQSEAEDIMDEMFANFAWGLDEEVEGAALEGLLFEIALLEELDAFEPGSTPEIGRIHQAYAPWPDVPHEAVAALLFRVDADLALVKNEVLGDIVPGPSLRSTLDEFTPARRQQIGAGVSSFMPHRDYIQSLSILLSAGTAPILLERGQIGAEMIAELQPALDLLTHPSDINELVELGEVLQTPVDDLETAGAEPGSSEKGPPWLLLAVIAGIAVVVAAALAAFSTRRRSGRDRAQADPLTDEILEAHRRLSGVVDESEIAEIGCGTAVAITAAHDALIFRREPEGIRRTGEAGVFVRSILDRVLETAQPLLTATQSDPAVGGPVAVCAVPLVHEGAVTGVLVVRSVPEHPFDNEDRRRLELLAPALAGALQSADTLDSFEQLAMVDGLTSLGNRRRLDGDLAMTLSNAVSLDLPVAFAMIDVDHFKQYNDTHGHEAGDVVLQTVAGVITRAVRTGDIVYRYGGEEFSVLLPGATRAEAADVAERVRVAVDTAVIPGEDSQPGGRLTVSVGVATLAGGDPRTLKGRADEALYAAKAQGRNRCVMS